MTRRYLCFILVLFLAVPVASVACTNWVDCPPYLENYEPPAGWPGITKVYILGQNFLDTPGTVSIGGVQVPANLVNMWSPGMIIVTVPDNAVTGPIVVTTQYGQDSSANEVGVWSPGGVGDIAANFTVFPPLASGPMGSYASCQNVTGTWQDNDGWGDAAQYMLTQTPNGNGGWNVSGSVTWTYDGWVPPSCTQPVSGTLDTDGNLQLNVGEDNVNGCGAYGDIFKVLSPGCNMTSAGYFIWAPGSPPPSDWLNNLGETSPDFPIYLQPVNPSAETNNFLNWVHSPDPSQGSDPTIADWQGVLSPSSTNFGGRVVFEQDGGGSDSCHYTGSPYKAYSLSGGSWYVQADPMNTWADDGIGLGSNAVQWYQQYWSPASCQILETQNMIVDTSTQTVQYQQNTLNIVISPNQICVKRIGDPVCENY
ncbi:MAG TPA: IPT/TIG domain-containing protein [Terriglobales bacterium]|nr:IPT/TIG domain-containing protein [Terriglobales bacterium]